MKDVARNNLPFEIDEATYRTFQQSSDDDPVASYPYPIVMADGNERMCDFVYTVGDDLHQPYLGFWREGERYLCQHIEDRLEPASDGMDSYLPPPPGWASKRE